MSTSCFSPLFPKLPKIKVGETFWVFSQYSSPHTVLPSEDSPKLGKSEKEILGIDTNQINKQQQFRNLQYGFPDFGVLHAAILEDYQRMGKWDPVQLEVPVI